ncbi:EAL domain-containing protein [Halomonas saccharevitans]|uniref:EAL domain-containing protein n=1 Tax=Halomonas saccharevitans TaxID=416872 RepID=A0ABU3NBK9_9GAMM|nr:EAL domain-containing protein [Halomonas saccharevitans]MDT8878581.1 EAL domain-containing protein [Halomonas saccharevitans]
MMKRARRRIVALATLGILVTGALVGLSTAWPLYQAHRQGLETITLVSASAQAETLDHLLARYRDVARQIASRTELRRRLEDLVEGAAASRDERGALSAFMAPRLVDAMLPSPDLVGLVRLGPAGEPLVTIGRVPESLPATDATAVDGQARLVPAEEGVLVEVTTPVLSLEGRPLGTDLLYFGPQGIAGMLDDAGRFGKGARQWLLAPPGQALLAADPQGALVMAEPDGRLAGRLREALATDRAGLFRDDDGAEAAVLVQVPLVTPGWTLLVQIPARGFYGVVYQELLWPATMVLVLMGLGALATARVISPLLSRITDQAGRLKRSANFDSLTGLPNRAYLNHRLALALERAEEDQGSLAVLFLDLDHFKDINDSLGHPLGDRLLQAVGRRLGRAVRDDDSLGRLGGDEFVLVLERLHEHADAGRVAQKLIDALLQPFTVDQHEIFIGASIGISVYPRDGRSAGELIQRADTAMYGAKALKRNTWMFFAPELAAASRERFTMDTGLRRALDRQELVLHYQPQARVDGSRVFGAEALVRWTTPEGEVIGPGRFIALAEEAGLIHTIGRWVLGEACRQAREWELAGLPLRVAVNLSGLQVVQGDIVGDVREALEQSGLSPSRLELEITEGFVIGHADEGLERLNGLRRLGIELAVDDFGTGYSSLSYLKRLPVQCLKIDRSFITDVPGDPDDETIVAAILSIADRLGLDVIAEGVENATQLDFLRSLGCPAYQGDYLSPPLTAAEFTERWGAGGLAREA